MAYPTFREYEDSMRHRGRIYDLMDQMKTDLVLRLGKALQDADPKVLGEIIMNAWSANDKTAEKLVSRMASSIEIEAFFGNYKKVEEFYEDSF